MLMAVAEELGLTDLSKLIKENLGDGIKLDVGGTIFKTTRTTLSQFPDSLLGRMFHPDSSLSPARMQDGAYLIDFSPSSFPVILTWLRYRKVALGEVTVETAISAASYFGLLGLVEELGEKYPCRGCRRLQERMAIKEEKTDMSKMLIQCCFPHFQPLLRGTD